MRWRAVNPMPYFYATCQHCGAKMNTKADPIFADLDGAPYKAYACEPCATSRGSIDRNWSAPREWS
jgi:hypothetical protein